MHVFLTNISGFSLVVLSETVANHLIENVSFYSRAGVVDDGGVIELI
jgi:hypothetical protein